MPRWIHTVFTWQHYFVHEQRVESTRLVHRDRDTSSATREPIFAAAAATSRHISWTVYCDCADCGSGEPPWTARALMLTA